MLSNGLQGMEQVGIVSKLILREVSNLFSNLLLLCREFNFFASFAL